MEDKAISLNAILEFLGDINMDIFTDEVKEFVLQLPPVIPNSEDMAMQYQRGYIDGFKECNAMYEIKKEIEDDKRD